MKTRTIQHDEQWNRVMMIVRSEKNTQKQADLIALILKRLREQIRGEKIQ